MTDFNSYQPPGVFVEEVSSPVVGISGTTSTAVAIVGPSRGFRTFSETILADDTTPVVLTKLGIIPASVVVASVNGATTYESGTDYTITATSGADSDLLTLVDNGATLTLSVGSSIVDGQQLRLTYNYADAEFYEAIRASDYETVKDYFGEALDPTTGAIISPLSLAAYLAFANGAPELVLVSTAGTASAVTRVQLSAGYSKIQGLYDVSIVVPLPVGISGSNGTVGDVINVGTDLQTHVETASAGGFYRTGILGLTKETTVNADSVATGIASSRVLYAFPNRMNYFNSSTQATIEIDGYYLAAAYAGRMANQAVEIPLTKKIVRGFAGIPSTVINTMTTTAKNAWSDAGVAVTELTRQRNLVVRHGTTTDPSSTTTREISLVRAKDTMIRSIEDAVVSAGLIGQPIRDNTVLQVKGIVQGGLESAVAAGTIVGYQNLGARLRPGQPQIIEVKFEYQPSYPLNYIVISFSINTDSGETDVSVGTAI